MSEQINVLTCANHPEVETTLRCSRCEKPICVKCAVASPTGYKCRECVRGIQKTFETTEWYDYPASIILAAVISFLGSVVIGMFGFFTIIITIFGAPIIGTIIAEAVRSITKKRRSMRLFRIVAIAAAVGAMPLLVITLMNVFITGTMTFGVIFPLIWRTLYAFLVFSTTYYRLSGIRI
jgi:hypothetical protein